MSETQSRQTQSSRGRSSARGRGGGYGGAPRGGPRTLNKPRNADNKTTDENDMLADQGELGEMKKRYSSQLSTLKELFPDWTEVDLVLALEETDGDLQSTIERISEGNVSQFSEIKKKSRDRARSKIKEQPSTVPEPSPATRPVRGRGSSDGPRESIRGRSERGRGTRPARGGSQVPTNGARKSTDVASVPTMESNAYDSVSRAEDQSGSLDPSVAKAKDENESTQQSAPKKTWASMFATPKPAATPKPTPKQGSQTAKATAQASDQSTMSGLKATIEQLDSTQAQGIDSVKDEADVVSRPTTGLDNSIDEAAVAATMIPPKDDLTEDNLEHLPDTSRPSLTETSASTVASSRDIGASTPSAGMPTQQSMQRTLPGGFATSAYRAAAAQGRSASFQRKIMEQQEAVVMPGNHAVDRTAVQFGSMGLNGDPDSVDVDEDREEAETRTQPPQHSPTLQPRAALPPAPRHQLSGDVNMQDGFPTAKQPGLISVAAHQQQQQQQPANAQQIQQSQQLQYGSNQNSSAVESQHMGQSATQNSAMYGHFGRYGQPQAQADVSAPTQKQYDPFSQQISHNGQFDGLQSHGHLSNQLQHNQSQVHYSSAPLDQASYYTSEYQRHPYQNYYGSSYGQQSAAAHQEAGLSQQRSTSGFGAALGDSGYPSSQSQQASSRYGDTQGSGGHNTPQQVAAGQAQSGSQNPQAQHLQQAHHSQAGHGAYPYGHPYYSSPYFNSYMGQYAYGGQNYGGHFSGKAGMYGQPHHGYGLNPQTSYEQHSSSPSNLSGFGQSATHGRESALSGSLGDYGRGGASSQTSHSQQGGSGVGGFASMPDYLNNRTHSGAGNSSANHQAYAAHHQQSGLQGSSSAAGVEDPLKAFSEAKSAAGPSPSALAQSGRPGSAAADKQQSQQQTQHHQHAQQQQHYHHNQHHHQQQQQQQQQQHQHHQQQQQQQQAGGYPSHLNHHLQSGQMSQYGGLGGLSSHQASAGHNQQSSGGGGGGGGAGAGASAGSGYSGYGGSFGNSYGSYGRGGWGSNYGH